MSPKKLKTETVTLLETQVDDLTGQEAGYVLQRLIEAGALDALCIPVLMKKGRPGYLFQVLCRPKKKNRLCDVLFEETGTLGIRFQNLKRNILFRRKKILKTSYGLLEAKERLWKGNKLSVAEFDGLARIARKKKIPLKDIRRKLKV